MRLSWDEIEVLMQAAFEDYVLAYPISPENPVEVLDGFRDARLVGTGWTRAEVEVAEDVEWNRASDYFHDYYFYEDVESEDES